MFLSNRAIFQSSYADQWTGSTSTGVGSMSTEHQLYWDSLNFSAKTLTNSDFILSAWTYNGYSTTDGSEFPVRSSHTPEISLSFSTYFSSAWVTQDLADTEWLIENVSPPRATSAPLFERHFNGNLLVSVRMTLHADSVGNVVGGTTHYGRTPAEESYLYDGFYEIDVSDGEGVGNFAKFKFPLNRSEVTDRWTTVTLSITPTVSKFSDWNLSFNPGANPNWLKARMALTNSDGTVHMDYDNSQTFNSGSSFSTWATGSWVVDTPWEEIVLGNRQFYNALNSRSYNTGLAKIANVWVHEGDVIDPKLKYQEFTNKGLPQTPSSSIPTVTNTGGVTPHLYLPIKDQTEVTFATTNDTFQLNCSTTTQILKCELSSSPNANTYKSELFEGNPYGI